jgi:putative oxidoreductase
MNNTTLFKIGVILYALAIGYFGVNHLLHANAMAGAVPSYLPGGSFWIYLSGAGLVLAAISFLINKYTRMAAILLALFLVIVILTMHLPGAMKGGDLTMLIKDTAILGGALMIAGKGN